MVREYQGVRSDLWVSSSLSGRVRYGGDVLLPRPLFKAAWLCKYFLARIHKQLDSLWDHPVQSPSPVVSGPWRRDLRYLFPVSKFALCQRSHANNHPGVAVWCKPSAMLSPVACGMQSLTGMAWEVSCTNSSCLLPYLSLVCLAFHCSPGQWNTQMLSEHSLCRDFPGGR